MQFYKTQFYLRRRPDCLFWPSEEGGFTVHLQERKHLYGLSNFNHAGLWQWFVCFEGEYSTGYKKTREKAIRDVLKKLAHYFRVDINYLTELMEYEILMHTLATISE